MMTATDQLTLSDFLLARIAEDEAVAQAVKTPRPVLSWQFTDPADLIPWSDADIEAKEGRTHIARWDPARVLAECEAKRRVVEEFDARDTRDGFLTQEEATGVWSAMQHLAQPFADHPDFRAEWRA